MASADEYRRRIQQCGWTELETLWEGIKHADAAGDGRRAGPRRGPQKRYRIHQSPQQALPHRSGIGAMGLPVGDEDAATALVDGQGGRRDAHRFCTQDTTAAGVEHADRPVVRVGHVDMTNPGCHRDGPGSMAHGNRRDEAAATRVEHADRALAPISDEDAVRARIDRLVATGSHRQASSLQPSRCACPAR